MAIQAGRLLARRIYDGGLMQASRPLGLLELALPATPLASCAVSLPSKAGREGVAGPAAGGHHTTAGWRRVVAWPRVHAR